MTHQLSFYWPQQMKPEGSQSFDPLLSEVYLAWGIRKNDVELLEAATNFIDMLIKKDELDPIINRWIPSC